MIPTEKTPSFVVPENLAAGQRFIAGMSMPDAPRITRRLGLLTMMGGALALIGCGGGGSSGAGPTTTTGPLGSTVAGNLMLGQITGFGSIILNGNGVRIDDSSARISDDDGNDMRGRLKLGMQVAVVTTTSASGAVTAASISSGGELQGRIEGAPNAALKTFVVLGQTVKVVAATVFDDSLGNGFASLAADTVVEVHGLLNAKDNVMTASYIEKKSTPAVFKIQGVVSGLNTGSKKFNIGTMLFNYSQLTDPNELRVALSNGALVRVRVAAVLPPTALPAEWLVTRIRGPEHTGQDRNEFEIEGRVTAFTSAKSFSVGGVPVDASSAVFEGQAATALALNSRVEVKGRLTNGTVIATRVKLEDDHDADEREFELHGTVGSLTATTFVLRGLTVDYGAGTVYRKGSVTNLVNGANVEVKGVASDAGASATRIQATRISFENS